ncbi:hypothetical protein LINPERHAP2_LOCUS37870 [Linum perenne]
MRLTILAPPLNLQPSSLQPSSLLYSTFGRPPTYLPPSSLLLLPSTSST